MVNQPEKMVYSTDLHDPKSMERKDENDEKTIDYYQLNVITLSCSEMMVKMANQCKVNVIDSRLKF